MPGRKIRTVLAIIAFVAVFSGVARAQRPYVQPVSPEAGTTPGLVLNIERATQWDIYFSSGYAQAGILGTRVLFKGDVTNASDAPYGEIRVSFTARDIFGGVLARCSAKTRPERLSPGESGSFRCAVKVPVAQYLNRITYCVKGRP